eukprot:CAMPEP_0195304694 /NCGR_PEP_ID=MMETSP0707-20130614/34930_1 /TAXON_ID=33640 /ORGANISM="Asterionellopsis glacialis, Strain CCMP134" /LENGTH=278 /DNA_ID=CAMNT_0040368591 /DNA_START=130 /DNA_END=966 /DNA_ORIENTATION=+
MAPKRMQFTLFVEKLKKPVIGRPDPYAVVTFSGGPNEGIEVGTTETLENTLNPEFTSTFYVDVDPDVYMPVRVEIFNSRNDKLMAEAEFELTSVYSSSNNMDFREVEGCERIAAHVTESIKGTDTEGSFQFQLRGLDILNVEQGVLKLGRSDPFFLLEKKTIDHTTSTLRWVPSYRSNHIEDNLNPYWDKHEISLEQVCYCDVNWPIRIRVMDWQKNGKHREIGLVETTVAAIVLRQSKKGNADREEALELKGDVAKGRSKGKTKGTGLIVVVEASVQ